MNSVALTLVIVIPNSFAAGERERDLTRRVSHHGRDQDTHICSPGGVCASPHRY